MLKSRRKTKERKKAEAEAVIYDPQINPLTE
jgi:hypothetical protein